MRKSLQLRLAESIDLTEKLTQLGLERDMEEMKAFRSDLNDFVRDGRQSSGVIEVERLGLRLQYSLRLRGNSVIFSAAT